MEEKSEAGAERLKALKLDLTQGKIDAEDYVCTDSANTILVSIIQHPAQTTLGQIDSRDRLARDDESERQPDSEQALKTSKYSSNDPEIKNAQSTLQTARDDLQVAKESSASPNTIKRHVDEVRNANNHITRTKNLQR